MSPGPSEPDPQRAEPPHEEGVSRLSTEAASPLTASLQSPVTDPTGFARAGMLPEIPGYQFIRELHRGGQGVVYEALQKSTNRMVAIKMLLDAEYASEAARKRFEREVRLVARMDHRGIITVHDSGTTADGQCYCIMDYIRGLPLKQHVRENRLPVDRILELFRDVCNAVDCAHGHGVIHRDLKPSNIMVDHRGRVVVLDFGLAKSVAATTETLVSHTGQLIGTWPYMSPEQTRAKPDELDARSDVYSLGVVLYELLTGRYPYTIVGPLDQVLKNIREATPALASGAWDPVTGAPSEGEGGSGPMRCPLNKDLDTILLKALAKEPERRYQKAVDFAADVQRYLRGEPITARRDSVRYRAGKQIDKTFRRHPVLASMGLLLMTTLLAVEIGRWTIYRWSEADAWWERLAIARFCATPATGAFNDVRVVGLTDDTDVTQLARAAGLAEVSWSVKPSVRRLHGHLMKRLAKSGCRVVVWDLRFMGPSEYDREFVEGVEALRAAGIDVWVSIKSWWIEDGPCPEVSPEIAKHARWASVVGAGSDETAWRVQLAAQRGPADFQPSLALAAFASFRHPGARVEPRFEKRRDSLSLHYWKEDPEIPGAKIRVPRPDLVPLSFVRTVTDPSGDFPPTKGLREGDLVGFLFPRMPTGEACRASTLSYGDVFTAADSQLVEWLGGRAVVLADIRSSEDRHSSSEVQSLSGCYVQSAALNTLLHSTVVSMPFGYWSLLPAMAGAMMGGLAALVSIGRRGRLSGWIGLSALAIVAASILAVRYWNYLFEPFLPLTALVLAAIVGARFCRVWSKSVPSSLA